MTNPPQDAHESPASAAIGRAIGRGPRPFAEEAAIVERFVRDWNASHAAAGLPGGALTDVALDDRGASRSIIASNGRVSVTFHEDDGRRRAEIAFDGRTRQTAVATGPDAVNFLAIELDEWRERLGKG